MTELAMPCAAVWSDHVDKLESTESALFEMWVFISTLKSIDSTRLTYPTPLLTSLAYSGGIDG
jgi:hypothetical protein